MTATPAKRRQAMLAEVAAGLSRPQKELSPKFFYDQRGSELFEEITELPEYYLTRTERGLLEQWAPGCIGALRPRTLVELGAGSAAKTRVLLDAMKAAGTAELYIPVDISADFLARSAEELRREYPALEVVPCVADISADFVLPTEGPGPVLIAFLGSTIGNFAPTTAVRLLRQVGRAMQPADRLLLGVDLRKDPARLEAAYNDARGVTAQFNRNVLHVLNRDLGANFAVYNFTHHAFYNAADHCVEMHLVSVEPQQVRIPGVRTVDFAAGETIRTEISCKHDRASVHAMLREAGLQVAGWRTDADDLFAVVLAAANGGAADGGAQCEVRRADEPAPPS